MSEITSKETEEKQKTADDDSLMQLNVVEAPSISANVHDDSSWANGNNDSYSSSSDGEESSKSKPSSKIASQSSEDVMFTRNIEESYIHFGSSLADVVSTLALSLSARQSICLHFPSQNSFRCLFTFRLILTFPEFRRCGGINTRLSPLSSMVRFH